MVRRGIYRIRNLISRLHGFKIPYDLLAQTYNTSESNILAFSWIIFGGLEAHSHYQEVPVGAGEEEGR